MITAKVIADSISPKGNRLTTLHLRFPRFILAEFNTHRKFSRNARSSRAVPSTRLFAEEIFLPEFFENKSGMQGGERITGARRWLAQFIWRMTAKINQLSCIALEKLNVHKQHRNRLIEPFIYVDVLVTSTNWSNFLGLRDHPDAQPEIQELARQIRAALDSSAPVPLKVGEWHLPYITQAERDMLSLDTLIKLSVARCARVSYAPFDGNASIEKELERYEKLIGSVPLHASPAEHQAYADNWNPWRDGGWIERRLHGNFTGWCQYRKTLPGEYI